MDVTRLPFNRISGIEPGAPGSDFPTSLPDDVKCINHLRTVHAGAFFAIAETASGPFLSRHFGANAGPIPVVRRVEAESRSTGRGPYPPADA